jgi:hypothetical protein
MRSQENEETAAGEKEYEDKYFYHKDITNNDMQVSEELQ